MAHFLTLNVGASKATLAEYALSGKRGLTLVAYGSADLIGADAESADSMAAALTPALRQIMREKGIRPAPLLLSLGGQTVFPRFTKFPAVSADKLEQLVKYEVEQNVPFPIDEIVCDNQLLGMTPEGEQNALIVAAKLDQVRAVTDAIRAAGLRPVEVDAAPMAIYNALNWAYPGMQGCTVVLDIGSRTTNLILVENGKIYNRAIPVAGNAITKEISLSFGCTPVEAEQLKLERGYVALGGVTEDEDEVSDRLSKVIRTVLTRLHAEISRSINFYRSQQGGAAPSRLFLTGGSVRLPQLDQFFMDSLQVDVEYLNPFTAVRVGGRVNAAALENDAFTLVESVGLALRQTDVPGLIRINLMPPELVAQARNVRRIPFLVVGAVSALAALGLGIAWQNHECDNANAQLAMVQQRNTVLGNKKGALQKAQASADAKLAKCDELQQLMRSRTVTLERLRAVQKSLLPGMWIAKWGHTQQGDEEEIVIFGWKDQDDRELEEWNKNHPEKNFGNVATVVNNNLTSVEGLVAPAEEGEAVKDDLKPGPPLDMITLKFKFAPVESVKPNPTAQSKQKGRSKK